MRLCMKIHSNIVAYCLVKLRITRLAPAIFYCERVPATLTLVNNARLVNEIAVIGRTNRIFRCSNNDNDLIGIFRNTINTILDDRRCCLLAALGLPRDRHAHTQPRIVI